MYADLALENTAMKSDLKKTVGPTAKRDSIGSPAKLRQKLYF
jgi:hypothetical protein